MTIYLGEQKVSVFRSLQRLSSHGFQNSICRGLFLKPHSRFQQQTESRQRAACRARLIADPRRSRLPVCLGIQCSPQCPR